MYFEDDRRAQAIQIGAVILLGAMVVAFSIYQAEVVPEQNKRVEFDHNQEVQNDLQNLRDKVVSTAGDSSTRPVSIRVGTRYSTRLVALNPPPPSGGLRTVGTTDSAINLSIVNATVTGDTETKDFWNGSDKVYETGVIVYRPHYNIYQNAPTTVYENTIIHNQFRDNTLTITGQSLVSGNRLSLVILDGNLSKSRSGSTSVDVVPVSASETKIALTNASGSGNITISVATRLTETEWDRLLSDEVDTTGDRTNDRYITNLSVKTLPDSEFNLLRIQLENGTYRLQMAIAGVGTGAAAPSAAYLTAVTDNGAIVQENSTRSVVVQVRDAQNNPITGTEINASANNGTVSPTSETSDADGEATFTYEATEDISNQQTFTDQINLSYTVDPATTSTFNRSTPQNVTLNITVENTDGSGLDSGDGSDSVGSGINPNSSNAVVLNGAQIVQSSCQQGNTCPVVDVTLKNLDTNNSQTIDIGRFNFYSVDRQKSGNAARDVPKSVDVGNVNLKSAAEGGQFRNITPDITVPAAGSETFRLHFYEDTGGNTDFNVKQGDFFVFSVLFENGRDATYFIAPQA